MKRGNKRWLVALIAFLVVAVSSLAAIIIVNLRMNRADQAFEQLAQSVNTPGGAAGVSGSGITAGAVASSGNTLVNINTASADLLQTLPGIGASKANAIVRYREENGPFTDKSQIKNVSGIGENLYNNIEQLICI